MRKRVLAVASSGGHWQQLMLIRPAFAGHEVHFATTLDGVPGAVRVPDCNRDTPLAMLRCAGTMAALVWRLRPQVIVTTGALPGMLALLMGRVIGARTIWLDSVANAEAMSMSGRIAGRFAHHRLSQWDHVARAEGAEFAGAVL
ncbi:UDP-N-acetylglucosamine--LPS N-acetylglucosamine transferase [Pseudooceanicola sp. MF1-13]|uniref:UDP-N-acetylglucosamine--LPS N-acetylglucosamine transferase n=1 Tax=Pseudooceanicola sp. MF1-13 TaxID=3379095 RepID=UPI003891B237